MTDKRVNINKNVRIALKDPERLEKIRIGTRRFVDGRIRLLNTLPDAEAVCDTARKIRAHTISHLPMYLEQFEQALTEAGGSVHWAKDGKEACEIVANIAESGNVKHIAKSKSMISEEIQLNQFLESRGLQIVETDLGEFIAQLSGDHPSHIIVPVMHLTRQEVGQVFHKKLHVPYTDDVEELNSIARKRLREIFLSADMGISGCNFAVVESGSICLVTNEGNGRMVTGLPRIHVALMGIERIVPTLKDLGVMLQLLGRSSTGQKLTTYTSLITGPRKSQDRIGPEELHVVIVDNGRSNAFASEVGEVLYCIRCGACLNACPVYDSIGGHSYGSVYPGPIGSVISPLLNLPADYADLPHTSTLCGACQEACPVKIDFPSLLLKLRSQSDIAASTSWWMKAGLKGFTWAAQKPARYSLLTRLSAFFSRLTGKKWLRWLPWPLDKWTKYRQFPPFAAPAFQQKNRENFDE